MSYNSLSGTVIGPDKITAKLDGTFTQITGTISGSYIDASGTAVSFADIVTGGGSGGTIGAAEDGTYADGLFTDFDTNTAIGTAVDRFNEIFKSLVPPPAPDVSRIDATQDGTDAFLSFGSSNDMSGDGTQYISVGTDAGFDAVDKGELYETEVSGNNFRRSIFQLDSNITGFINFDVTASVLGSNTNYTADAFKDAQTGSLSLYINSTSTAAHTLDLSTAVGSGNPGAGNSSSLNGDGSGFTNISVTASAVDANSNTFDLFQHRTARYIVHSASQRRGWNYAFVRHTVGAANRDTNFIEWVNDDNSVSPTITATSLTNITIGGSRYISGVQYNTGSTADYQFLISNFYKNVYNLATITTSSANSNLTIAATPTGTVPHIGSDDENKTLPITRSVTIADGGIFLNQTASVTSSVTHIFKGAATGNASASGFLIFTPTVGAASETQEFFRDEATWRIVSGTYASQNSVNTGSWTSSTHMTGSGNHADGLQIYNQRLVSPLNTTNGGDFSSISNTESGQPDYSGISGTRTFYRAFKNAGSDVRDVGVRIKGSATIVSSAASLGSNANIRVLVKTPGKTDWMNLADDFSFNDVSEGAGANELTLDSGVDGTGAYNIATLGTKVVATGEYFLVKIEADAGWTGNITEISVTFGAGTGSPTYGVTLDEINETTSISGSTAKLSFGTSKAITGYTSVGTSPNINGAVDVNESWAPNTGLTNQRLGIYNKTIDITAKLNDAAESYRIDSGSIGTLRLYINGVERHSIDFASFGSGNDLNTSGSGFQSVSAVAYPTYNNSVRDYTRPYRTGSLIVDTNDQRNGWNFVRVSHSGSWGEEFSSYIEWINDDDSSTISITGGTLGNFANDGTIYYSSGIRHFNAAPSASFTLTSSNNYKNVYDDDTTDAIDFNDNLSNLTITAVTSSGTGVSQLTDSNGELRYPTLLTNANSETEDLNHDITVRFSETTSLVGEFVDSGDIHTASFGRAKFLNPPFNNNNNTYSEFTSFSSPSKAGFLRSSDDTSNTDENDSEGFGTETYRLQNRNVTYSQQSHISGGSGFTYAWDSEYSVNDEASYANYSDGLVVFGGKLIAPPMAGITGSFSTLQAPAGNPDYRISQLSQSTRTYVRYFKNTTGSDKTQFNLVIYGSGTLDRLGAGYNNSSFKVEYKFPSTNSAVSTAWLDAGRISQAGNQNTDGQGGAEGVSAGYFPLTISTSGTTVASYINLLGGAWENGKYLLMRIQASASWDGYIDRIEVS